MQVSPTLRPQRIRTRVPNDPSSPNNQVPGVGPKPRSKHRGSADSMLGVACVRRAGGPARRFRHQTGYGCNQAQTTRGEAVAGARGFRHRAGACESNSQGRGRSVGGEDHAQPVIQPSHGKMTQENRSPEVAARFRSIRAIHGGEDCVPVLPRPLRLRWLGLVDADSFATDNVRRSAYARCTRGRLWRPASPRSLCAHAPGPSRLPLDGRRGMPSEGRDSGVPSRPRAFARSMDLDMDGWWCVRYGDAVAWVEAPTAASAVRRSLDLYSLGDWTDDARKLVVFPQSAYSDNSVVGLAAWTGSRHRPAQIWYR